MTCYKHPICIILLRLHRVHGGKTGVLYIQVDEG